MKELLYSLTMTITKTDYGADQLGKAHIAETEKSGTRLFKSTFPSI